MRTVSEVFAFVAFLIVGSTSQSPLVDIDQGTLAGKAMTDRHGREFYAFQGIPYGKPPINELRFKAPQPADGWEGVRDATSDAAICIQQIPVVLLGSEDCLYLHVYTPELPSDESRLRPVMVWMHGGAFSLGSGGTQSYGPEFLMTRDIVLVTINYRIGIFGGFSISHPQLGVPGNPGLKDQVLALKWVNDNIERFGGDPDGITIFGESAGGSSVHLHMLSPMSTGLFNKVIAQSGVALMDYINGERNNGLLLAERLDIQTDNLEETLATLQGMPASTILSAAISLASEYRYFHNPQVEMESSEPAFLINAPNRLLETGQYNHCPLLLGVNDQEGLLFQYMHRLETMQNITVTDFSEFIPMDLQLDPSSDSARGLANRIKQFYFGDEEPTPENIVPTVNLYTDFTFVHAAYRAAIGHVATMDFPIFFYIFTSDTRLNMMKHRDETTTNYPGAAHADELTYLFYNAFVPEFEENSVEDLAIERMVTLWTNFAKFGDPTPDGSGNGVWEPMTEEQFKYLHIDSTEVTMEYGKPLEERMKFWNDVYDEFYPRSL